MSAQTSLRKTKSRSSSCGKDQDSAASAALFHRAPTSFFLATEDMLSRPRSDADEQGADSTFGVRSIPEASDEAAKQEQEATDGPSHIVEEDSGRRRSTLRACSRPQDGSSDESIHGNNTVSQSPPLGFPRLHSTLPSVSSFSNRSLPSSPKSTSSRFGRPSDDDSVYGGSQAVASSEEEADIEQAPVPDITPQLIMPSIQMPSRRPFTERGGNIGRLKILLAGDSGELDGWLLVCRC